MTQISILYSVCLLKICWVFCLLKTQFLFSSLLCILSISFLYYYFYDVDLWREKIKMGMLSQLSWTRMFWFLIFINRKFIESKLIWMKFEMLYSRIQHSKKKDELTTHIHMCKTLYIPDNLDEVAILEKSYPAQPQKKEIRETNNNEGNW